MILRAGEPMSNHKESSLPELFIVSLICIAAIYFFAMRSIQNDFVDDCMSEHSEIECEEMWRVGNE